MPDADELLVAGDLDGARAVLTESLRKAPGDQTARMFLFQLLCVQGEWERARTHLRALASLSPEAQMLAAHYGTAIDAEQARAAVFAGEQQAEIVGGGGAWTQGLVESLQAAARGDPDGGGVQRAAALDAAPSCAGELNGKRFESLRDADPRFGPALEVIVIGRYGLAPFDALSEVRSQGPSDLRDLVWLPAELVFRSGRSANALLPVRYPGTETAADAALKLARGTNWIDQPWGQAAVGQHLWDVDDDEADILSLRSLRFD